MKTWPSALMLLSVILFAGLAGACSRTSGPTPQPVPRVGVMHVGTDHNPPSLATLVAGLGDLGWFDGSATEVMQQLVGDGTLVNGRMQQLQGEYDGQRIQLIWRNLDGKDQAEAQAQEFVRERVDLIVAFEDKSIARGPGRDRGPGEPDPGRLPAPVGPGPRRPGRQPLAPGREPDRGVRCARPGRQAARGLPGDPAATRRQPLRLLTLVDPTDIPPRRRSSSRRAMPPASSGSSWTNTRQSDDAGLEAAFDSLTPGAVDGVFILSPSLRLNFSKKILGLAAAANLPVQAHRKEWVDPQKNDKGALFSFGVDVAPVGTAAARFVDSILKGAKPADLPAQEVPKVEFALSLKRAAELGIEVPDDVVYAGRPGLLDSRRPDAGTHGGNARTGHIGASSGSTWRSSGRWSRRPSSPSGSASPGSRTRTASGP